MNLQLRQCFTRAKSFRPKKARKSQTLSGFLISKKAKDVQKKAECEILPSKKPKWQPWSAIQRLHFC